MEKETFETFKPKNELVKKYVNYYYLDIKPDNLTTTFQCFPHFNTTISLYSSHERLADGEMVFIEKSKPFQIFTPVREKVLRVKQSGKVYRIVIVFNPLGIQQFYRDLNFNEFIFNHDFFTSSELNEIFSTTHASILSTKLDDFLLKRLVSFEHPFLEKSLQYIFNSYENFSVIKMSNEIGVSRQHLNRVFKSNIGISLKKFHEIVLFRKTINNKLFENTNETFTELAHRFNFSDQPHFNKTYKNLTEHSPKKFFDKGTKLGKEDTFWHL
ncbi:HTH-type transcriptional activator Btr [Tenacibaculum sp. 190130A14a]|uniref:HTH-type transcriptional activator Btr n=1 Tax=Tenacibaculum polynesiense TaxID=3137857 RepID=A0ABP1ET94_9FLAO